MNRKVSWTEQAAGQSSWASWTVGGPAGEVDGVEEGESGLTVMAPQLDRLTTIHRVIKAENVISYLLSFF